MPDGRNGRSDGSGHTGLTVARASEVPMDIELSHRSGPSPQPFVCTDTPRPTGKQSQPNNKAMPAVAITAPAPRVSDGRPSACAARPNPMPAALSKPLAAKKPAP